ncbi:chaperone protein TorD [mine drainage metagenome]|uniref:Chaperone protein TorD n=1 Tax=mine drainage metagenome TaxID=410659 RepID=A0A1J5SPA3_9ZZZZ
MSLAPEDRARADYYAVLARLFQGPPDAAFLAALAASRGGTSDGDLPRAWQALTHAAAAVTERGADEEFSALFVAVGRPQVVLYASWYLTGFMMEQPLAALRDDLAALGLARHDGVREPEDHFSALLEVMRHLIIDDSRSEDERIALQREFFNSHIVPWSEKLCDALDSSADAVLYRVVAGLTRALINVEKQFLQVHNKH